MRIQEAICRAISGQIRWFQAAEILGVSVRTMGRLKTYYERKGYDGLFDRRRRQRYSDFNVKHFHEKLTEEHGIALTYTWVKAACQQDA